MKISVPRDAQCGQIIIPRGDYWVSLRNESGEINLAGGGKDYRLPAKKRRTKVKGKTTTVTFYCGGGTCWSLVISTPKFGEWIAMLEVARGRD